MFQRHILLTHYIYIKSFQSCSCCTSSRTMFGCWRKHDKVPDIRRRNSKFNITNKGNI